MELSEIKELIVMVSESDLAEFQLEDQKSGIKLQLRKALAYQPTSTNQVGVKQESPEQMGPASKTSSSAEHEVSSEYDSERYATITAPMVGVFYRSPAPDADPYVEEGDQVEVGQALCIIEAMKLMNEIESEVDGRIVDILAENAQPVEYGQPLFVVEKE